MSPPDPLKYASGEPPMKGDTIVCADPLTLHREGDETWIVTSISDDMVRAKCDGAPQWKQAFYTAQMNLAKRKNEKPANRKKLPG